MANNTLDKAVVAIPNFGKRIKLFTEKLRIAQYADETMQKPTSFPIIISLLSRRQCNFCFISPFKRDEAYVVI